jgi:hypothetical protein
MGEKGGVVERREVLFRDGNDIINLVLLSCG